MDPTDEDFMTFELPDGSSVFLFTSLDNHAGEPAYFWVEFDREKVSPVWYRVYAVDAEPGDWLPMEPARKVLRKTGTIDEGDNGEGAQLGAMEKLDEGRYALEAKVEIDGSVTHLSGVTVVVDPALGDEAPTLPANGDAKTWIDEVFDDLMAGRTGEEDLERYFATIAAKDIPELMRKVESIGNPQDYMDAHNGAPTVAQFFKFIDFVSALIITLGDEGRTAVAAWPESSSDYTKWVRKYVSDKRFHAQLLEPFS